ncbi:DUF6146 family protein [Psychroserpens sp. S379A]|uniref:DUF6146 family protein n=1 Tax=Psychroserpens sp. S379A TaxID=3415137 RepID=UPI003C7E4769
MKPFIKFIVAVILVTGCNSSQSIAEASNEPDVPEEDLFRLTSDELEYDIIIIEPGFNAWLASIARPEGYYSQPFMEARNRIFVQEWNSRVLQPLRYDSNMYQLQIDYLPNVDYGYEVNYKLYNYFIYFQLTYNQRLSSFVPRI